MIIEKLSYTKGEKAAEIAAAALAACSVAGYVVLMILGKDSGAAMIMILATLILYAVCTLCSTMPQHTNVFTRPEKCSEKQLRYARRAFIIGKILFIASMFAVTAMGGVTA